MTNPLGGFTQIPVGPQPVQVCPPLGQGQSVTLYNQDIANVITIGTSNDVAFGASNGAPLEPLTSGVFPASKALYAAAPAGTANLVVIPEGGSLSPSPAQIAAQIALTGLSFTQPETTLVSIPVTQPSSNWGSSIIPFPNGACAYELVCNPIVAADPWVNDFAITHYAGQSVVKREWLTVSNYPGINNEFVRIRGNLHGNALSIGGSLGTTAFMNGIVPGGGLTAGGFTWTLYALFTPIAATSPRVDIDAISLILGTVSVDNELGFGAAVACPANTDTIIAMLRSYTGKAWFNMASNTAAQTIAPLLAGYTVANGFSHYLRLPQITGASGATGGSAAILLQELALAPYWYRMQANNVSATAGTVDWNVIGADWT